VLDAKRPQIINKIRHARHQLRGILGRIVVAAAPRDTEACHEALRPNFAMKRFIHFNFMFKFC
jgi:hypothetical protein